MNTDNIFILAVATCICIFFGLAGLLIYETEKQDNIFRMECIKAGNTHVLGQCIKVPK